MKNLINNEKIKKIIIIFITIIMVSNFVFPNYVCAFSVQDTVVNGIFYLIAFVGDKVLETLQNLMIGNSYIGSYDGGYEIQYSPGIIFSNEVPAFDINFINPSENVIKGKYDTKYVIAIAFYAAEVDYKPTLITKGIKYYEKVLNAYKYDGSDYIVHDDTNDHGHFAENSLTQVFGKIREFTGENFTFATPYHAREAILHMNGYIYIYCWYVNEENAVYFMEVENEKEYELRKYDIKNLVNEMVLANTLSKNANSEYNQTLQIVDAEEYKKQKKIAEEKISKILIAKEDKTSIAKDLQSNIATWYIALRTIALVGLLSVLVYIGIRIIIGSTSAEKKAKYKSMLKDWLVALCILFILHYIMAFMLEFTEKVNEIIKGSILKESRIGISDTLMNSLRYKAGNMEDKYVLQAAGYTIMYLAMVILTLTFTIQYLKRVIFMAFLTMVAPMVALTYPLDKIKGSKAQAFSYWLKEYIFNCLIQPVHLLIYTIFISNALSIAETNMLYAIACLAFIVPAEKYIKSMFGMKSESPISTIGAAAGGALVMNAINKMKNIKGENGKNNTSSGSSSNVRTANNVGGASNTGGTGGSSSSRTSGTGGSSTSSSRGTGGAGGSTGTGSSRATGGSTGSGSSRGTGTRSTGETAITGSNLTGRKISGVNKVGSALFKGAKGIGKYGAGALLGLGAGTFAIAANIADGDLIENPTKAAGEIAGAGLVGYSAGKSLTGRGLNAIGRGREYLEKQALGVEEYNNRKFDKAFYKSDDYKMIAQDQTIQNICKANNVSVQEATQTFLNEGITDAKVIKESLRNGISGEIYSAYAKEGVKDIAKVTKIRNKHIAHMNDEEIIGMMKLAKVAPKNFNDFKRQVGEIIRIKGRKIDEEEAERIYKTLVDFF